MKGVKALASRARRSSGAERRPEVPAAGVPYDSRLGSGCRSRKPSGTEFRSGLELGYSTPPLPPAADRIPYMLAIELVRGAGEKIAPILPLTISWVRECPASTKIELPPCVPSQRPADAVIVPAHSTRADGEEGGLVPTLLILALSSDRGRHSGTESTYPTSRSSGAQGKVGGDRAVTRRSPPGPQPRPAPRQWKVRASVAPKAITPGVAPRSRPRASEPGDERASPRSWLGPVVIACVDRVVLHGIPTPRYLGSSRPIKWRPAGPVTTLEAERRTKQREIRRARRR